jgi:hypothetical protein
MHQKLLFNIGIGLVYLYCQLSNEILCLDGLLEDLFIANCIILLITKILVSTRPHCSN